MSGFIDQAKYYLRNPLGIIALAFVFAYSIACIIFPFCQNLPSFTINLFAFFIVIYPVFVFVGFCWLVTCHHTKLYGPMDFPRAGDFMGCAFGGKKIIIGEGKSSSINSEEPRKPK
jgi:hypothetical protein